MVSRCVALKQLKMLDAHGTPMRLAAEGWDAPYKTLLSTIMSARTRDEVTIPVAKRLFDELPSLSAIAHAPLGRIEQLISRINFYRNKAANVKRCAQVLEEQYGGVVPLEEHTLLSLPGVGRKTVGVFLSEQGLPAIGVDTHVAYIARYLGWTRHSNPDQIQKDLLALFPKKVWKQVNPVMVRFGKSYSPSIKHVLLEKIKRVR